MKLQSFALRDVRLTGGPLKEAMELNRAYLLSLDPDRLLSRFREYAGLPVKAEAYPGWEQREISGHTLGHYLSACSMMAAAGDSELERRTHYIVSELSACQAAHGDGYVSGIPRGKALFEELRDGNIRSGGFDLNGGWVPFYALHKLFAGLRDAYRHAGSGEALQVERRLGDWLQGIVGRLSDEQMQLVLACEFGGMNEVLADLAEDTGEPVFSELSEKFVHREVMIPLAAGKDELSGRHANTQIPKLVGAARQFEVIGKPEYRRMAEFFWNRVTGHHSYVIGGNSMNEHFGEPGLLNDRLGSATCETCNTYNMLKLTRHLFSWSADSATADYYERAMYNHILASQHKKTGEVCYFVSLEMGGHKVYRDPYEQFSCCIGSGMENHASYASSLYFHSGNALYVAQYAPSELNWRERDVVLTQETDYPNRGHVRIRVSCKEPVAFSLRLRVPGWAEEGVQVSVNGKDGFRSGGEFGFVQVEREWRDGDCVELELPMTLRLEAMPDNKSRIAYLYGPLVLAGDLGPVDSAGAATAEAEGRLYTPVLLGTRDEATGKASVLGEGEAAFRTEGLGYPRDIELRPFYQIYDRRYSVYWDLFDPQQWRREEEAYTRQLEQIREQELRTVDFFQPGEMQPERDHDFQGQACRLGVVAGRKYRDGWLNASFTFTMDVLPEEAVDLAVVYSVNEEPIDRYRLLLDGHALPAGEETLREERLFLHRLYRLPRELTAGKSKAEIAFVAEPGCKLPKVFGVRVLRREMH